VVNRSGVKLEVSGTPIHRTRFTCVGAAMNYRSRILDL